MRRRKEPPHPWSWHIEKMNESWSGRKRDKKFFGRNQREDFHWVKAAWFANNYDNWPPRVRAEARAFWERNNG